MLDLKGKKYAIFGIQGSGKTVLAKHLLNYFNKPIVYEVHPDYRDTKAQYYRPNNFSLQALDEFSGKIKQLAIKGKCDLLNIDEADLFFKNNFDINTAPKLYDLVINHRHYRDLALSFISRRPQDLPTKIIESCYAIFIFKLEGANAIQKFSTIHPKIPALIDKIDYRMHNFIVKELGKEPYICNPVRC